MKSEHDQLKQSSLARGKPEWQKNTIRVCGNWSEQLSSKGKVYFYNCITEVSQWAKPGEWTLPDMTQVELHKILSDRHGSDAPPIKRSYSSANPLDKSKSKSHAASSPKRIKYRGDRQKAENTVNSRVTPVLMQNSDLHNHGDTSKSTGNARGAPKSSTSLSGYVGETNNKNNCLNSMFVSDSKVLSPNRSHLNDIQNSTCIVSRIVSLFNSQSNRSPAVTPAPASERVSPCLNRYRPQHPTPQQPGLNSHSSRVSDTIPTVTSTSTLPETDNAQCGGNASEERRYSLQGDRPTDSPLRATTNAEQVLRNFVSVLSHVRGRQIVANSTVTNSKTTPVPVVSGSHQPSVVNLISSLLDTHCKPLDGRVPPSGSSPAASRGLQNGIGSRAKEDRLMPPSSDGASVLISPYTRSSPSPRGLAPSVTSSSSDFRNHPQKLSSPLDSAGLCNSRASMNPHQSHNLPCTSWQTPQDQLFHRRNRVGEENSEAPHQLSPLPLDTAEMLRFVNPMLTTRFQHPIGDSLESEAQSVLRNFDRLHSVLYSELSGELKKLRALVGISEAKLQIHQKRKESLQDLMDSLESRKPRPSGSVAPGT